MNQKLFAIWQYDIFPFVLGVEMTKMHPDGMISAKGYGTMAFKPIKLLPLKEGQKLYGEITSIAREYNEKKRDLENYSKIQIDKLLV